MSEEEKKKIAEKLIQRIGQDSMNMFSLLVESFPHVFQPVVLATIQAGINSALAVMSEQGKEWFKQTLEHTTVTVIPPELAKRMMEMDRE